jgi:hypothetical protein
MESENKLPEIRTAEQIRADELKPYWLDPTVEYPEPHFLYEFHGVGFSPLGGIQAISGQKKNGKTFVLAQLMAAALGYGNERIADYLPGLTIRESTVEHLGHAPRVLYCDTEMERLNSAKVLRRVHWLCGWDMKAPSDRFAVLWLREVPKPEQDTCNHERWRLIKSAIEVFSPDIVFVDGLRDLVNDFNSNEESSQIINEMMSLASQREMCIWNVLHMNPRPSNDDESKMRGHLGTELGNKVSDTFISIKKKDATTGDVTFCVKQNDARGKDVDDWKFRVTDDAGGLGIPRIIESTTTDIQSDCDAAETIMGWLDKAEEQYPNDDDWPMTKKQFKTKVFGEIGGQKNYTRQTNDLKFAIENKLVLETSEKSGNGTKKVMINPDRPFFISTPNGRANERYIKDDD